MKVLLHQLTPFALEAGPWRTAVTETRAALEKLDLEVDYLRWFDGKQTGDILHFFGRMPAYLIPFAHQKGMSVVITDVLGVGTGILGRPALKGLAVRFLERTMPNPFIGPLDWDSYRNADACVVTEESDVVQLQKVFRVPPDKIHLLPANPDLAGPKLLALYGALLSVRRAS